MKLGYMIKKLCREQNITIAELARRSGVPKQTIHNWITGARSVNPLQVIRVTEILNTTIHRVFYGENDL